MSVQYFSYVIEQNDQARTHARLQNQDSDGVSIEAGGVPTHPQMDFFFSSGTWKGNCSFIVVLCSVTDRIDFAIVERLRKFNCSIPFRYFLIAIEQSDFSV